jgi:hypothetical protein
MENQYQQPSSLFPQQQSLPNATAILVLGIVSIVTCFCYGIPGLICGIIAIILSNKALELYKATPEAFTEGSLSNVKAGRICAIVGISISIICIIIVVVYLIFVGTLISSGDWYRHLH